MLSAAFLDEQRVELIAEEWCDDYRNPQRPTSHCREIAKELGCDYLACDPLEVDWKRLGIKRRLQIAAELGKSFYPIMSFEDCAKAKVADEEVEKAVNETADAQIADAKRECFWLIKLIKHKGVEKNTLMICGYDHTESFTALLQAVGYEAQNLGRVTDHLPERNS